MKSFQDEYLKLEVKTERPIPTQIVAPNGLALWRKLFPFEIDDVFDLFPGGLDEHLRIDDSGFTYRWPSAPGAIKRRPVFVKNGVKHFWDVGSSSNPPFWPEMPTSLPKEIYFCEGESDTIVARWLGLPAFALTKGVNTKVETRILEEIADRGVRTIYLLFDDDETGRTVAVDVKGIISTSCLSLPLAKKIDCHIFPIAELLDPFFGEKDLRQAAQACPDVEVLSQRVAEIKRSLDTQATLSVPWVTSNSFLQIAISEPKWVVEDILSPASLSMISGFPKMGKSYLALDLAVSIASGTPFLNFFPVRERGDVLYIAKETTDLDLQDRVRRVQAFRNLPDLPPWENEPELHFLLHSDFRFDSFPLLTLREQIETFHRRVGRKIALVIVDPFSYALPQGKFDINSYSDFMSRVANPVRSVIEATGTSFLIIYHQGKGEGSRALGSTAIEGAYTNSISYLTKERNSDGTVELLVSHRDSRAFKFTLDPGVSDEGYSPKVSLSSEDFSVQIKPRNDSLIDLLWSLLPEGEFSFKQYEAIVRASHDSSQISYSALVRTFDQLVKDDGMVKRVRHGVYQKS